MPHRTDLHAPHRKPTAELEDLAAAHALGALPDEEAQAFRVHLRRCSMCASLFRAADETASVLARAVEDVAGSPDLRVRLLASAAREAASWSLFAVGLPPGQPTRGRFAPRWRAYLPVAALLIVTLGLAAWNVQLKTQSTALQQQVQDWEALLTMLASSRPIAELAGTPAAPGARGLLLRSAEERHVLLVAGLEPLSPAETYQIWVIRAGRPLRAGLLSSGRAQATTLEVVPAGSDEVALTREPAGGRSQPMGPIVLAGRL